MSDPSPLFYISGPMSGLPHFNYPAFDLASKQLEEQGMMTVSPHLIDNNLTPDERAELRNTPEEKKWAFYMTRALRLQLLCTAWVGLPGWTHSRGARREFDIAVDLQQDLFILNDKIRMPPNNYPLMVRIH